MKRLVIFLQGGNFVSSKSCLVTRIINKRLFFMARAGHELSEGAMTGKTTGKYFFYIILIKRWFFFVWIRLSSEFLFYLAAN